MNYVSWELSLIACLPALILCVYVYLKDRVEKEPIGLLALLFALGAAGCFPALFAERWIAFGIDRLFAETFTYAADGTAMYASEPMYILHMALTAFLGVSLSEVLMKGCVLFFVTHNNRHFNYLFDGIVYSVFVSLGFAAAESTIFAFRNGWETLLLHLLTSVPCHLFVGILMGYFYSHWHAYRDACTLERQLFQNGQLTKQKLRAPSVRLLLAFVMPLVLSGTLILAGTLRYKLVQMLFTFVVFLMFGFSFISVDRISAKDRASRKHAARLLAEKHPEVSLSAYLKTEEENGNA